MSSDRTLAGPATIFLRSCESELSLNAIQHRKLDFFIAFQPYTLATSIVPREDDHDEQTDGEGGSGPCRKHTFCPKSGSTDTSSGSSTYQASKPSSESGESSMIRKCSFGLELLFYFRYDAG